ncbi:MAG: hypothetical protein ACE5GW_12955, partial [Planctomycetota bacterium]
WLRDEDLLALSSTRRSIEADAPPPEERGSLEPAVFGLGRAAFYPRYSHWVTSRALERSAGSKVSFATQGHTTTPVLILAEGPGAERFQGLHLNRDVGKALREWMVLPVPERRATR